MDNDRGIIVCPYCGSKDLIVESDDVVIEKIRSATKKEMHHETLQYKKEKEQMKYQRKLELESDSIDRFRNGGLKRAIIIGLVISFLGAAVGFNDGQTIAGLIGIGQILVFTLALLIGERHIRPWIPGLHFLLAIIGFMIMIPYMNFYNGRMSDYTLHDLFHF